MAFSGFRPTSLFRSYFAIYHEFGTTLFSCFRGISLFLGVVRFSTAFENNFLVSAVSIKSFPFSGDIFKFSGFL